MPVMKPTQTAKNAAKLTWDVFEDIAFEKTTRPMITEMGNELGAFLGAPRLARNPQALAQEDLQRARDEKEIQKKQAEDKQKTNERIQAIRQEYRLHESSSQKEQKQLQQEFSQMQSEVAKLAKAAGVETKAHLEQMPKKIGILDIKRLTTIIRFLRIKAEESKSAKDLVAQRANAKPATGMLAWVSGKQMKVHEQGTLQLQG